MEYYIGMIPASASLQHHGILGMKWGTRHGPPYPLDYQSHSVAEKRLNSRSRISAGGSDTSTGRPMKRTRANQNGRKYSFDSSSKNSVKKKTTASKVDKASKKPYNQSKNSSSGQSVWDKWESLSPEKKSQIKKTVAIAAGVTMAAAIAYTARRRYLDKNVGYIIKAGTKANVLGQKVKNYNRPFYTSTSKMDKMKYNGVYALQRRLKEPLSSTMYSHTLKATKDVKVAPNKVVYEEFKKLWESGDEDFRHNVILATRGVPNKPNLAKLRGVSNDLFKLNRTETLKGTVGNADDKLLQRAYDALNTVYVDHQANANEAMNKLFSNLKAQGYHALSDVHDKRYSTFKSNSAVIVFDNSAFVETAVKKMNLGNIMMNYIPARAMTEWDKIALTGAGALGLSYVNWQSEKKGKKK